MEYMEYEEVREHARVVEKLSFDEATAYLSLVGQRIEDGSAYGNFNIVAIRRFKLGDNIVRVELDNNDETYVIAFKGTW